MSHRGHGVFGHGDHQEHKGLSVIFVFSVAATLVILVFSVAVTLVFSVAQDSVLSVAS
jgi:hypothetical protein